MNVCYPLDYMGKCSDITTEYCFQPSKDPFGGAIAANPSAVSPPPPTPAFLGTPTCYNKRSERSCTKKSQKGKCTKNGARKKCRYTCFQTLGGTC